MPTSTTTPPEGHKKKNVNINHNMLVCTIIMLQITGTCPAEDLKLSASLKMPPVMFSTSTTLSIKHGT
jgi:hypothetical protein